MDDLGRDAVDDDGLAGVILGRRLGRMPLGGRGGGRLLDLVGVLADLEGSGTRALELELLARGGGAVTAGREEARRGVHDGGWSGERREKVGR